MVDWERWADLDLRSELLVLECILFQWGVFILIDRLRRDDMR